MKLLLLKVMGSIYMFMVLNYILRMADSQLPVR